MLTFRTPDKLAGWTAEIQAVPPSPIALVTFRRRGEEVRTRLDIGKAMFIDEVPPDLDKHDIAQRLANKLAPRVLLSVPRTEGGYESLIADTTVSASREASRAPSPPERGQPGGTRKRGIKDGKFFLKGEAPWDEMKNKVWDKIKSGEGSYQDLIEDVTVSDQGQASARASPRGQSYTVRAGDTLSKIAKAFYGDANAHMRIFEANKDKLSEPGAVKVGQVLSIPPK